MLAGTKKQQSGEYYKAEIWNSYDLSPKLHVASSMTLKDFYNVHGGEPVGK